MRSGGAPSAAMRSASCALCMAKRPIASSERWRNRRGRGGSGGNERSESRPLTSATGIPRARARSRKSGQSSVSVRRTSPAGRRREPFRRARPGRRGRRRPEALPESARCGQLASGGRRHRKPEPAPGARRASSASRLRATPTSPTETAWTQMPPVEIRDTASVRAARARPRAFGGPRSIAGRRRERRAVSAVGGKRSGTAARSEIIPASGRLWALEFGFWTLEFNSLCGSKSPQRRRPPAPYTGEMELVYSESAESVESRPSCPTGSSPSPPAAGTWWPSRRSSCARPRPSSRWPAGSWGRRGRPRRCADGLRARLGGAAPLRRDVLLQHLALPDRDEPRDRLSEELPLARAGARRDAAPRAHARGGHGRRQTSRAAEDREIARDLPAGVRASSRASRRRPFSCGSSRTRTRRRSPRS